MRKICVGIVGILAYAFSSLSADGYCEREEILLVDKDFPFPPDESALPENVPLEENNDTSFFQPGQKQVPAKKSEKAKASKDVFPPHPGEKAPS